MHRVLFNVEMQIVIAVTLKYPVWIPEKVISYRTSTFPGKFWNRPLVGPRQLPSNVRPHFAIRRSPFHRRNTAWRTESHVINHKYQKVGARSRNGHILVTGPVRRRG